MGSKINKAHRAIYKYLKAKAESLEGKPSKTLVQYRQDQLKSSKRKFSNSNIQELTDSIEDSDIIYLGDFHTFDQSTRNLQRLIRVLTSKRHKFAIGLEFVNVKFQKLIDYFLAGHITELEFLESINYKESWRFPWTYYSQFFKIARAQDIPILALNTEGSLSARDDRAAKVISKFYNANEDHKVLVLFGEYHIVRNKLPEKVMKTTNKGVIQTIIHQNLDEVYWKLFKEGKKLKDVVVKFNKREFVLITSAPWLKYESQIYWFDHISEDPEFDIHEYLIETGALNFSENVPDNFVFICEELNKALSLNLQNTDLEDFNLFDHIKLNSIQRDIDGIQPISVSNFYSDLIKRGRSFKILGKNKYFCPNYSINRISYLAGIHTFGVVLKKQKFNVRKLLTSRRRDEIFVYFLKQCLVAYFTSKMMNPYRKCDMYQDYKKQIRSKQTKESKKNLYRVGLSLLDTKKPIKTQIKGIKLLGLYNLARMTGHMLGDILFDTKFSKVKNGFENVFEDVFEQIFDTDMSEDSFFSIRNSIHESIEYKKMKKRVF